MAGKPDDEMVTIATFGDPIEAEVVKNLLTAEGVPAFVTGGESGGLFAGMGGQFGLVRLLVAESNRARAEAILERPEEEPDEGAEPAPSTSIKAADWARESVAEQKPRDEAAIQPPPGVKEAPDLDADLRGADTDAEKDEDEVSVAWGAEDYAARAWKAAVIGLLVFPPLLHIYSVYCLIRSFNTGEQLSPAGIRKVRWAMIFDMVALTVLPFACCGGWISAWPRLLAPRPPPEVYDRSAVPADQPNTSMRLFAC